ncbi:flagellin [Azospirillum sp. sgz301742]
MTSISSYGQYLRMQSETQRLQRQQLTNQIQASSGKKGTAIGDLGVEAKHSLNLRAVTDQLKTYKENISEVELYASAMDTAMGRMGDMLNELRDEYTKMGNTLSAGKTGLPDPTFLNELGKRGLEEMKNLLNTKVEGRYVFASSDIHNAPVPDVSGLYNAFQAEMTANLPGAATAAQQTDLITNLKGYVGLPNTTLASLGVVTSPPQAYLGGAGTSGLYSSTLQTTGGAPLVARVDIDRQISYGLRADAPVFQDMMRAFATAATITAPAGNLAGFQAVLDDGADATRTSITNLSNETGRLGITRKQIADISTKHDAVSTNLKSALGDVEDVDMAEVATKLQQSNTALEATYRLIASMKSLSLVNFLS